MAFIKDLYAKHLVSNFLWGENHQRTLNLKTTFDLATSIIPAPISKTPENSMLLHASISLLLNRGFTISNNLIKNTTIKENQKNDTNR